MNKKNKFKCVKCSSIYTLKQAFNGCKNCKHHIFVFAAGTGRAGTPQAWDLDKEDPYERQKRPAVGADNPDGYRMTTMGDEGEGPGGGLTGGYGTRFRGFGPAPDHFSETSDEYEKQVKDHVDTEDTNLDYDDIVNVNIDAPQSTFAHPLDTLSNAQKINRSYDGSPQTIEKQLMLSRSKIRQKHKI